MKRVLVLLMTAVLLISGAWAETVSPSDWIQAYNKAAAGVNAPVFVEKDGNVETYDEGTIYLFTEDTFLAMYVGSSGNADAVVAEVCEESMDTAAMLAAAVSVCDSTLKAEDIYQTVREAEKNMLVDDGSKYAYLSSEGWLYILAAMDIGDKTCASYWAVREADATDRLSIIKGSDKPNVTDEATGSEATPCEPEATPTPTPTPTPAPTPIPEDQLSKETYKFGKRATLIKNTGFKAQKDKLNIGITDFEVSVGDGGKALSLTGWAYGTDSKFDGDECDIYIIVLNSKQETVFYEPVITPGATGMMLYDMGTNLDQCEFKAAIDVSWYPNEDYQIGVGVHYKVGSREYKYAYTFGDAYKFKIVGGVITAVGGEEVS